VEIRREFSKARRAGSNLCLVMTDLDHFKRVNDEHGHQRGDRVLQEFAKRLRQAVRASDTLYRLGGEEFAMLLPGTDIEQGRVTAEKLRLRVAESPLDRDVPITASFGVAVTDGNESPDEFYRRADQAMYAAKEAGRNRVEVSAKDV
jgi:diguanylate cyclase (GGDEF)-like protein